MKPDPTKDPEFKKVVQHLLNTPHQSHSEMRLGKHKAKAGTKANPKKRERPKKASPT